MRMTSDAGILAYLNSGMPTTITEWLSYALLKEVGCLVVVEYRPLGIVFLIHPLPTPMGHNSNSVIILGNKCFLDLPCASKTIEMPLYSGLLCLLDKICLGHLNLVCLSFVLVIGSCRSFCYPDPLPLNLGVAISLNSTLSISPVHSEWIVSWTQSFSLMPCPYLDLLPVLIQHVLSIFPPSPHP